MWTDFLWLEFTRCSCAWRIKCIKYLSWVLSLNIFMLSCNNAIKKVKLGDYIFPAWLCFLQRCLYNTWFILHSSLHTTCTCLNYVDIAGKRKLRWSDHNGWSCRSQTVSSKTDARNQSQRKTKSKKSLNAILIVECGWLLNNEEGWSMNVIILLTDFC